MSEILTTSSTITCAHGGQVILSSSNHPFFVNGSMVLLENDKHRVKPGTCQWTEGSISSPCIIIIWSDESNHTTIYTNRLLTKSSNGKCYNASWKYQGSARISSTQHEVISI